MRFFAIGSALLSTFAYAQGPSTLAPGETFEVHIQLFEPTTFVLSSGVGAIQVVETAGDNLELSLENDSNRRVTLDVQEVAPGKIKVEVAGKLPPKTQATQTVSPTVAGLLKSFLTSLTGGIVHTEIQTGSANLVVGVPRDRLRHLKVETDHGAISLIGNFDDQMELNRERIIVLSSSLGKIECQGTCAQHMRITSSKGDLNLAYVRSDVEATTHLGRVVAHKNWGFLILQSSTGDIVATENLGATRATTNLGNITVSDQVNGLVVGKTSTGDVTFNNPRATGERGKSDLGIVRYTQGKERCQTPMLPPRAPNNPFDF